MSFDLKLEDLGSLDQYQTFPHLLRTLMRLAGHQSDYDLERALLAHRPPLPVSRQWIKTVLKGTSKIQAEANLANLATYFQIARYPALARKWRELAEAQGVRTNGEAEITTGDIVSVPGDAKVPEQIAREPEVAERRRSGVLAVALAFITLLALGFLGWPYLPVSAKEAMRIRVANLSEKIFGRPLSFADVGLTSYDWITASEGEIVAKVTGVKGWPIVDSSMDRDDPIALTLACFRAAIGGPQEVPDEQAAKAYCERGKALGEGRAVAYLVALEKPKPQEAPPPLTLADFRLDERQWDWMPADEIVSYIDSIDTWSRVNEGIARGDRLAIVLGCLHDTNRGGAANPEANCLKAKELGEGRATLALAGLWELGDPEGAKALRQEAVKQGAFYAAIELAGGIALEGISTENQQAFFDYFEKIDKEFSQSYEKSVHLYNIYLQAMQARFYGMAGTRDISEAARLSTIVMMLASNDDSESKPMLRGVLANAFRDQQLLQVGKEKSVVAVGGNPNSTIQLFVAGRFSSLEFRNFFLGDLARLRKEYPSLRVVFMPIWDNALAPGVVLKNNADFAAYLALSCTAESDREQLLNTLMNLPLIDGKGSYLDSIWKSGMEASKDSQDFIECARNRKNSISIVNSYIEFIQVAPMTPDVVIVNGVIALEIEYDSIKAAIELFSTN